MGGDEFRLWPRLIEVGESIRIELRGAAPGDRLEVFPRYLESGPVPSTESSPAPLAWLDEREREVLPAQGTVEYRPAAAGNYLARWTSHEYGVEYRYFAAIDPSYVVYRPTIWCWPTPFPAVGGPEIHDGGLPFDWCISSDRADEPYVPRLLDEQRRYGGAVVYGMTAAVDEATRDETVRRLAATRAALREVGLDVGRVANLWHGSRLSSPKVAAARAAGFDVIDGYVPRASSCGLGAPYYPFYIGPADYRLPSQYGPTTAIACVFDFVGSWHFHGPIGFHRPSARGSWERARFYIDLAAQEAALTARNSGVHNFLTTLINFESPAAWGAQSYELEWDEDRGREFLERYLRLLAFEHPRRWPIAFARAVDYADYFRAHYAEMPRRIVSSITHDPEYDRWWTDEWHEQRLTSPGYVPVHQSLRDFRQARAMPQYNMPVSWEIINYNDNRRTCRFEHACPKPVHYYDLTGDAAWPEQPRETDLPDPEIESMVVSSALGHTIELHLRADRGFADYLLVLWDLPRECAHWRLTTNAKELVWVENTDGHCRGIVRFDLEPRCTVTLRWEH
ncbi:MAG: hypothetical protein WDA75_13915 [Candidatus Latescibacterota bacterium]